MSKIHINCCDEFNLGGCGGGGGGEKNFKPCKYETGSVRDLA